MKLNFLTIPNYKIYFDRVDHKLDGDFTINYFKFINVHFLQDGRAKKSEFSDLQALVEQFSENNLSYNFVEIKIDNESFFRFIDINKSRFEILYFQHFSFPSPNKWQIFFNSVHNIVARNLSKRGNKNLNNNKYFRGIDFYIGVSALLEVFRKTNEIIFEDLIPLFNSQREFLLSSKSIIISESIELSCSKLPAMDFLKKMIGLDKIKEEISAIKSIALINLEKKRRNIPVSHTSLHMVFSGYPGTGKTTVARLIGEIYHDLGILKSGHLVEVTSGQLEGKYVGHTAPQTIEYFQKAIDGVLFIDEAYTLLKSGSNFGKEVIETLLKLMEDNRDNIMVIIAGYPGEMQTLLSSNVGFRDRFSTFINFENYSKSELKDILLKMVNDIKHKFTPGANYKLDYLIEEYFDKGYFNSNARTVRNIFETIQKRQSIRLSKIDNPSDEELITFIDMDVPNEL